MKEGQPKLHNVKREIRVLDGNRRDTKRISLKLEEEAQSELAKYQNELIRGLPRLIDFRLAKRFFSALVRQAGGDSRAINFLGPKRITGQRESDKLLDRSLYKPSLNIIYLNTDDIIDAFQNESIIPESDLCKLLARFGHEEAHAVSKNVCTFLLDFEKGKPVIRSSRMGYRIFSAPSSLSVEGERDAYAEFEDLNEGMTILAEFEFLKVYARIKKRPSLRTVNEYISATLSNEHFRMQVSLVWYLEHVLTLKQYQHLQSAWKELRAGFICGEDVQTNTKMYITFGRLIESLKEKPAALPAAMTEDSNLQQFRYAVQSYIRGARNDFPKLEK